MRITTYEKINEHMETMLNIYLRWKSSEEIKKLISLQGQNYKNKFTNRLIEIPEGDIKDIIKEQYIIKDKKYNYLQSETGTVKPEEQLTGIRQMALLLLISNRLGKECKEIKKNIENKKEDNLYYNSKKTPEQLIKKVDEAFKSTMLCKDKVLSDLIANLYIFKHTTKIKNFSMLYGNRKDEDGRDTFTMDLAKIGPVCVHYGSKEKMEFIIKKAMQKAETIIGIKCKLGQISKEEAERLKSEINTETILPQYKGKFYEYVTGIPLEYSGNKIKKECMNLGIYGKQPEKITSGDIDAIYKDTKLNDREKYYLAVKLGVPDDRLIQLAEKIEQKQQEKDTTKLGKRMLGLTTPEERRNVANHERINWRENDKDIQ